MPPLYSLKLIADRLDALTVQDALEGLAPSPLSIARFEETEGGPWQLDALYDTPPERERISSLLRATLERQVEFDLAPLPEKDWVEESLKGLAPVRAGRVVVHGAHDRADHPAGTLGIEIDAGAAFGTGHHATTLGCLLALQAIGKSRTIGRVLDVGTGTGVLAIAAARLYKARTIASDIDPVSVSVAMDNARINRVAPAVTIVRSRGLGHAAVRAAKPYDVVLANILARPLLAMAGDIAAVSSHRTKIVLSGLLDSQSAALESRYRAWGMVLIERRSIDGWTTLVLTARP